MTGTAMIHSFFFSFLVSHIYVLVADLKNGLSLEGNTSSAFLMYLTRLEHVEFPRWRFQYNFKILQFWSIQCFKMEKEELSRHGELTDEK